MIIELFFVGLALGAYFVPTMIARVKKHPHALYIGLFNLLFGWTLFGWGLAMVWAFTIDQPGVRQ